MPMLEDVLITIRTNNSTKKHYEKLLGRELKYLEYITIPQKYVKEKSHVEVLCSCDRCGTSLNRKRRHVDSKQTVCRECEREWFLKNNPNPSVKKKIVECKTCKKKFRVVPSIKKKQKNHYCSRDCYFVNGRIGDWKESNPERIVREWLEKNDIEFEQEVSIGNWYSVDFYIPNLNKVIEVYGDYWHANPKIFGEGKKRKLTEEMVDKRKRDEDKKVYINNQGMSLCVVWEGDIYDNVDFEMNKIFNSHRND